MAYSIYTDHPESQQRRQEDFDAWLFWSRDNAPWSGVSLPDMAALLKVICARPDMAAVCTTLDTGGALTFSETRETLQRADTAMTPTIRGIFEAAVRGNYGVRVEFARGPFGALSASEYMAKFGSDAAH